MLILASQSPRRRELLHLITDDFSVIPADIDEDVVVKVPSDLAKELSKMKAYEILKPIKMIRFWLLIQLLSLMVKC